MGSGRPLCRTGSLLRTVLCAVSGSAGTNAAVCCTMAHSLALLGFLLTKGPLCQTCFLLHVGTPSLLLW